jgi:hypothetical protein
MGEDTGASGRRADHSLARRRGRTGVTWTSGEITEHKEMRIKGKSERGGAEKRKNIGKVIKKGKKQERK